jgi:hypothetical protein
MEATERCKRQKDAQIKRYKEPKRCKKMRRYKKYKKTDRYRKYKDTRIKKRKREI